MIEFDWSKYTGNLTWLQDRTVYMTRAGSWAYGTNIESSDVDYRGVAIVPPEYYLGPFSKFEQAEVKDPDMTIFCLRKFVTLASQGNPNILELLFTDESDICHDECLLWGWMLRDMRSLFVTKRCRATYAGYATGQLKKIKNNTDNGTPGSLRFERIQRFGFDTKQALHLVRLFRMCREILETGEVNVKRKDAAELLAIRNGAWTLPELCEYAEHEDSELDAICEKSCLPEAPDVQEIERRTVNIMREALESLND